MSRNLNEAPMAVKDFRRAHGISAQRMSAILGAMFPANRGLRFIVASDVLKFMRANVTARIRDFNEMREEKLKDGSCES